MKNKKPFIKVLIGPPCSGKSTWVKNNTSPTDVVLSRDAIVLELCPDMNYTDAFNTCNQKEVDKIFKKRFSDAIMNGDNIIIDKTNLTSTSRKKLLANIPDEYFKVAVLFDWDKKELLKRNIERNVKEGKFIPEKVFDDMINSFVPVRDDEGFDKVISSSKKL
jgi:predicted kinase